MWSVSSNETYISIKQDTVAGVGGENGAKIREI
jgi:hypothetical protein